MIARFADAEHGGFFSTSSDHEQLVARRKDLEDAPIPSGVVERRARAAAAGRADRRARPTRSRRPVGAARWCTRSPRATRRRSATCCRRSTSTSRRAREVALVGDAAGVGGARARSCASACRPRVVLAGGPGGATRRCRCWRAARRSTAARPRTCASASPAARR